MRTSVLILVLLLVGTGLRVASGQDTTDTTYTVESGDTLYDIARDVGVSVRTLMEWNNLEESTLQIGQTLRIRPPDEQRDDAPAPSAEDADTTDPSDPAPVSDEAEGVPARNTAPVSDATSEAYTAEAGDTFVHLALRLGTTADTLFALNDSTVTPLSAEQRLRLPPRFGRPTHLVERGETLYSIAGQYGVSVRSLKNENDLETNSLDVGQHLLIPGYTDASIPPSGEWARPDTTGRISVYPATFSGRLTASGESYDPTEFVASHPSLPFQSVVLLSTEDPSTHVFARVIDRGPVEEKILLEVSDAVAEHLGLDPDSPSQIAVRVVWRSGESD